MQTKQAEFIDRHGIFIEGMIANVGRILADDVMRVEQVAHSTSPHIVAGAYTLEEAQRQFPYEDEEGLAAIVRNENRTERVQAAMTALYCRGVYVVSREQELATIEGPVNSVSDRDPLEVLPPQNTAIYRSHSTEHMQDDATIMVRSTELQTPEGNTLTGLYEIQQFNTDQSVNRLQITTVARAPVAIHPEHTSLRLLSRQNTPRSDGADFSRVMYQFLHRQYPGNHDLNQYIVMLRKATTGTYNRQEVIRIIDDIYARHLGAVSVASSGTQRVAPTPQLPGVPPKPEQLQEYIELTSFV